MTEAPDVLVDRPIDSVLRLVINRPEHSNALTAQTASRMLAALQSAERDLSVHAVLITGAGDRAFCGGYDLGAVASGVRDSDLQELLTCVRRLSIPTVAVVAGHAVGAGFDLACSCDLRVVRPGVKVGLPAVRLGVAYAADGLHEIMGKVPASRRILLTGELLPAEELAGFADALVRAEDVQQESLRIAGALASASPLALAYMVYMVRAGGSGSVDRLDARRWREQILDSEEPDAAAMARATGTPPVFSARRVQPVISEVGRSERSASS